MIDHLHLVDGGGWLHRAYHGAGGDHAAPPAALASFAAMLGKLEYSVRPRRGVVAFDVGGRTFRHELFADYKAHREAPHPHLRAQLDDFPAIARACGWPAVFAAGVEADDVIATLVTRARARGWRCTVYAADKDLLQLVGDDVHQVDARNQVIDAAGVRARLGVAPERVADFLAFQGDAGDGVPGVAGVGPKTAAEWCQRYPDVEAAIADCPKVRGKLPLAGAGADQLRLSRRLVELARDVDLGPAGELDELVLRDRVEAQLRALTAPRRPPEQLELGRAPTGRSPPTGRSLPVSDRLSEDLAERAAILEFDAGLPRAEAEARARALAGASLS